MSLRSVFARALRAARTERGITQAALAEACGRSVDMISRLERASIAPSLETIEALAGALDIHPAQLLGGTPAHPSPRDNRVHRLIELLADQSDEKLSQIERVIGAL